MSSQKSPVDGFIRLKFIGFCMSQTPPGEDILGFKDLVKFAQFKLCEWRGYLMKDPIWDQYLDEEILVEYYATLFAKDKEQREEFEAYINSLNGGFDGIVDWMDAEILKNREAIEKLKKSKEAALKQHDVNEEGFDFEPAKTKG